MPNGGVPRQMLLTPAESKDFLVYCTPTSIVLYKAEEFRKSPRDARPLLVLSADEAKVLSRFMRYWLQDGGEGPIYHATSVSVDYDY